MEKIKIVTASGFECEVDEGACDDMRLFELMVKHDEGDRYERINAVSGILSLFLGEEQKKALYGFLTERDGRPKVSTVEMEMLDILSKISDSKKK